MARKWPLQIVDMGVQSAKNGVSILGVSHRTAELTVRDALARALQNRSLNGWVNFISHKVGAVVVSTCNRVEWVISESPKDGQEGPDACSMIAEKWREESGLSEEEFNSVTYRLKDAAAIDHIFRVTSALESLVPGEPQILGQVKSAYFHSRDNRLIDPTLESLFNDAFRVARKIRRETEIGTGRLSVASLSVDALLDTLIPAASRDGLPAHVLMLGTGKTARLFLRHWKKKADRLPDHVDRKLYVTGRTWSKVFKLANECCAEPVPWEERNRYASKATAIVGAVSVTSPVFMKEDIELNPEGGSDACFHKVMVDLSVPKSLDPEFKSDPRFKCIDVDALRNRVEKDLANRQSSFQKAEELVSEGIRYYLKKKRSEALGGTIQEVQAHYQSILDAELEKLLKGRLAHLSEKEQELLRAWIAEARNRALHVPIMGLKEMGLKLGSKEAKDLLKSHLGS